MRRWTCSRRQDQQPSELDNGDYTTVIYLQQKTWWLDDSWHGNSRLDMWIDKASWAVVKWAEIDQRFMSSCEQCYSRIDVMSGEDEQLWCVRDFLCDTRILYCKSKFVLLLRLGYLKPFLAGSKKTRQGPGCRIGALCINRCWFCLTVVAGPK